MSQPARRRNLTLNQVAALLDESPSVIRYWEREFGSLSSEETRSGRKRYTPADLERIKTIHYLLRVRKFTIAGAREKLDFNPEDVAAERHLRETLTEVRNFLEDLKNSL